MTALAELLVVSLLFFLPLVVFPMSVSFFEIPKVIFAQLVIVLLFLLTLISPVKLIGKKDLKLLLPICMLLVLALLSVDITNPNTLFGNIFRLQGVLMLGLLMLWAFSSGKVKLDNINKWIPFTSLSLLTVSTLFLGENMAQRAVGTLGEPNALAAASVFLLCFIVYYHNSLIRWVSLVMVLSVVWLSESRSGLVALVILITFRLLHRLHSDKRALLVCLALVATSLVLPFFEDPGFFEKRSEIWITAAQAPLSSPLLGLGFGNIQDSLHQTSVRLNNNVQYQVVDSSHNFLLDYWVQGGILGLGLILFILCRTIQSLYRQKQLYQLSVLLVVIVAMLFNPVSIVSLMVFWWVVGQALARS